MVFVEEKPVHSSTYPTTFYIFQDSSSIWRLRVKVETDDSYENDNIGTSLSSSSDRVIVGVPGDTVGSATSVGAAYVYHLDLPLVLLSVNPIPNDTDALPNSNITATFSENMNEGNPNTYVVHGSLSGKLNGTYSGGSSPTLTFDPQDDFKPGEEIAVTLTDGIQSSGGISLATPYIWEFMADVGGSGEGYFRGESVNFGTGKDYTSTLALGDVDGDGDIDIVADNDQGALSQNVVFFNDGQGIFTASPYISNKTYNTEKLTLADIDNDGDLDSIEANQQYPGVDNLTYINDGLGNFTVGSSLGLSASSLAAGDLDGDGDIDMAFGKGATYNEIYFNDGSGNFSAPSYFGPGTDNANHLVLADVNGDGDLDIIVGNENQQNTIYLNDGTGAISNSKNFGTGNDRTKYIAVGDLDLDGDLDIAVGNWGTNEIYVNDGDCNFTVGYSLPRGGLTESIHVSDINHDGQLDVISADVYRRTGCSSIGRCRSTRILKLGNEYFRRYAL